MKPTERTTELRRVLVATAETTPFAKRPPVARIAIAAIAAFALAGAASGAAVASGFPGSEAPTPAQVTASAKLLKEAIVGEHAQLFGEPFTVAGQATTTVLVGAVPDGADALAVGFDCLDRGDFTIEIDGVFTMGVTCDDASVDQPGGGGGRVGTTGAGSHTLRIDGPGRYIVWAQWSKEHELPASSAEQDAALADGSVTEDEYRAGFDRFAQCMESAGYPLVGVNLSGTVIDYSIVNDAVVKGVDTRCYESEFAALDAEWQGANEDTSSSTQFLRDCLSAAGIVPAQKTAEVIQQFADNGLIAADCY